ncbi:hypothetical protein, partial [Ectobacillus funiculus]|uniref:hypothetical protein n=1 Tax=Ectobacillus funiculus TaxID=137993 RepID=UPI00196AA6CF
FCVLFSFQRTCPSPESDFYILSLSKLIVNNFYQKLFFMFAAHSSEYKYNNFKLQMQPFFLIFLRLSTLLIYWMKYDK